jgi:uncharacterized Zn finger protein
MRAPSPEPDALSWTDFTSARTRARPHLAATFYLLAESFDDDPFVILAWRGREREDLLDNLQTMRTAGPRLPTAPN